MSEKPFDRLTVRLPDGSVAVAVEFEPAIYEHDESGKLKRTNEVKLKANPYERLAAFRYRTEAWMDSDRYNDPTKDTYYFAVDRSKDCPSIHEEFNKEKFYEH